MTDSLFRPLPFPNGTFPPNAKPHYDWVQTLVSVSKGSEGFDISPDGKELWTAGSEGGTLSIINTETMKLTSTIEGNVIGANRLKFTPDGKMVLVTSLRTGDLFVFSTQSRKELKRLNTGHGAAGILIDSDGSRAFIGCTPDNYIAIVNLNTFEIMGHINISGADGLAWCIQ